jgi:hypothetical protein
MTLDPTPTYPATRSYVLRLHRDARPEAGELAGRLEHLGSGASLPFDSAESLLQALRTHALLQVAADPQGGR